MSLQTGVIIFALFAQFSVVIGVESLKCPSTCTCHDAFLSELPISSIKTTPVEVDENLNVDSGSTGLHKNEVLDEMDGKIHNMDYNPQLKMAVCVLQSHIATKETFEQLRSIEVLVVLQNPDTENVTFTTEDFSVFERLIVLEIHGFAGGRLNHNRKPSKKIRLRHDVLRQLKSLQYINLEYVELLGSPAQGSKILPVSSLKNKYGGSQKYESNDISVILQPQFDQRVNNRERVNKKPLVHHLVFLEPNQTDEYILPYKVYKEEQEKLGLYSFSELGKLKFLRVFHCNLREIYWDMFEGLQSLETLIIEGNDLLFLPDFAFYGTPNLRYLSLSHNKLLSLQSMSLAGLLQLKHLDVSHNNISHLSELSLPPFPKLHSADFRENPLEIIFPSTFEIMNSTKELYLGSMSTVVDIQPNSFFGLKSLNRLLLSNINVDIFERDYLKGMPKLRELRLEGKIKQLAFDAFLEVPKIEKLILKNCSIGKISMDSFYGLYNLLLLDLSYNSLNVLPPGIFDQLFSLRELSLSGNNLTELPIGIFSNFPAKMIRLDKNPWHCTCAMKDWQSAVVNRVRQIKQENKLCQFRFDKGTTCPQTTTVMYLYDKSVAPRCSTPAKYQGWSVFHLLRKELRCHKNKKTKIDRRAYLEQKLVDYERMKEKHFSKSPMKTTNLTYPVKLVETNSTNELRSASQLPDSSFTVQTESPKELEINEEASNRIESEPSIHVEQNPHISVTVKGERNPGNEIDRRNGSSFNMEVNIVSASRDEEVFDANNKNYSHVKQYNARIENETKIDTSRLNGTINLTELKADEPNDVTIRSFEAIDREYKMNKYKQKLKIQQSEEAGKSSFNEKFRKDDPQFKELKKMLQKDLELKRKEKLKFLRN